MYQINSSYISQNVFLGARRPLQLDINFKMGDAPKIKTSNISQSCLDVKVHVKLCRWMLEMLQNS